MDNRRISHRKVYLVGAAVVIVMLMVFGVGLLSTGTYRNQEPTPVSKPAHYKIETAPILDAGEAAAVEPAPASALSADASSSSDRDPVPASSSGFDLPDSTGKEDHPADTASLPGTPDRSASADGFDPINLADIPAVEPATEKTAPEIAEEDTPGEQTSASLHPLLPPPADPDTPSFYTIQVGAFKSRTNAQRNTEQMRLSGYDAFIAPNSDDPDNDLHAVRFGRFATLAQARKSLAEYTEKENGAAMIVRMEDQ